MTAPIKRIFEFVSSDRDTDYDQYEDINWLFATDTDSDCDNDNTSLT